MRWALVCGILIASLAWTVPAQSEKASPPADGKASGGPVSVGFVVDNSGSYRTILERVINAADLFVDGLEPGDEGFLVTFVDTAKIKLRQEMTRDKAELKDAAESMFVEGGPTAVLDAVVFASKYMSRNASEGDRSRALVLITDGDDRENAATLDDAVQAAKAANVRIFVVGIFEEKFYTKVVDRLTRETGGAKFVAKMPKDVPSTVAAAVAALRKK